MQRPILTAEGVYRTREISPGSIVDVTKEPPALRAAKLYGREDIPENALAGIETKEIQAFAYINEGRWVVDCPFCPSAQVGSPNDPRFMCADCFNVPVEGALVPVLYPEETARLEIEATLGARPFVGNLNWTPAETIDDLVAENIEHRVVLP